MEINDKEIADWVNHCPTHKIEVLYSDENGIQLLVNFNNVILLLKLHLFDEGKKSTNLLIC